MTFESRNIRNLSAQKNSRFRLVSRRPGDHEGNDGDVAILGRGAFGGGVTLLVKSFGKWYDLSQEKVRQLTRQCLL